MQGMEGQEQEGNSMQSDAAGLSAHAGCHTNRQNSYHREENAQADCSDGVVAHGQGPGPSVIESIALLVGSSMMAMKARHSFKTGWVSDNAFLAPAGVGSLMWSNTVLLTILLLTLPASLAAR